MTTPAVSPYICIFVLKPDSQQNPEQGALIHRKNRKKMELLFLEKIYLLHSAHVVWRERGAKSDLNKERRKYVFIFFILLQVFTAKSFFINILKMYSYKKNSTSIKKEVIKIRYFLNNKGLKQRIHTNF